MLSRRQVLGGVAAGGASSLAGCTPCGETWFAYSLTLDVTEIAAAGSAHEYEVAATVDFESLPWPEPDNQAVTETAAFTDVAFVTRSECASRREPFISVRGQPDVGVRWARPIPADSCKRPYLEDLTADGDAIAVTVGLHDAPHVLCRDCDHIGYSLSANRRGDGHDPVEDAFSKVVLVHVSTDGEGEERIVVPIDGTPADWVARGSIDRIGGMRLVGQSDSLMDAVCTRMGTTIHVSFETNGGSSG